VRSALGPVRVALLVVVAACTDGVSPGREQGIGVALSLQAPAAVSQSEATGLGLAFGSVDQYEVVVTDSLNGSTVLATTLPVVSVGPNVHRLDLTFPDATAGLSVFVTVVGRAGTLELYRASGYARVEATTAPRPVVLPLRYTGPGIRGTVTDENGKPRVGATVALTQSLAVVGSATTGVDGSYVFLPVQSGGPLAPGSALVTVTPPPQQFVCPAGRTLGVTATSSLVANFRVSTAGCPVDLLIVSGGDVDDTRAVALLFANSPTVRAQTFFHVNRTPGLAYLTQFDAVLLFANGHFNESVSLGSEIAAYVQAGGNLVIGSFYWQNRSDSNLGSPGWGALEALDPFASLVDPQTGVGGETYRAGSLGLVTTGDNATSDALVQGLSALTSTGYRGGVVAKAGTTVVARWSDGTPLVGYRILPGGQRLVAISLYPASGPAATGDVLALWDNAVRWTGAAGGSRNASPAPPPVFDALQPTGVTNRNAQTSQRAATTFTGPQVFDDFTLTSPAAVTRVEWQGIYCVPIVAAPAPVPTASSFTVAFYPDANNAPDRSNPLSVATYPIGRVAQTFVSSNPNATCGAATPTSIPLYSYSLTLNAPFLASAGVRYWLSVQANTPDMTVFWGWMNGTPSNNRSIQILVTGAANVLATDRAFALRP
jgi:hypothetical protein